jgi:hypothetical protein
MRGPNSGNATAGSGDDVVMPSHHPKSKNSLRPTVLKISKNVDFAARSADLSHSHDSRIFYFYFVDSSCKALSN